MFGNVLSKGVKEKWSLGYLEQVVKRSTDKLRSILG